MAKKIFILAAEASGDLQGAFLIREIKKINSDIIFGGVGGPRLREQGAQIWYDAAIFGCIGPWNAIPKIPMFLSFIAGIKRKILEWSPDLIILIDSPAINMRIGKFAKQKGFKTVYYFPPSAWYSSAKRVTNISQAADYIIPVFDFTVATYEKAGVKYRFFGHPLRDIVEEKLSLIPSDSSLPFGKVYIALLPGSRKQEINALMPVFLQLMQILDRERGNFHFLIPVALPLAKPLIMKFLKKISQTKYTLIEDGAYSAFKKADIAVMASGSATLEAAIAAVPMIVVYKLAWPDWILGKLFVKVPFFALPNLIMQRQIVPELLQEQVNPERLADEVLKNISNDAGCRDKMLSDLKEIKESLGRGDALPAIAKFINDIVKSIIPPQFKKQ